MRNPDKLGLFPGLLLGVLGPQFGLEQLVPAEQILLDFAARAQRPLLLFGGFRLETLCLALGCVGVQTVEDI